MVQLVSKPKLSFYPIFKAVLTINSLLLTIINFLGDVELRFSDSDSYLHNTAYATNPLVVHGNGASKVSNIPVVQFKF